MTRSFQKIAFAVLITFLGAVNANSEEATTVNVALFDVSAVAPGFAGQGIGGMGMMGRRGFGQLMQGFGMQGPDMMGGGNRQGVGQGMMGMGAGMMGQGMGMMGPGMMSIRTDKPVVNAGAVTFDVINWSRSLVHEMVVVAVDSPDASLPYDYSKQVVVEEEVNVRGETEELPPNGVEALTLDLQVGSYLLICNLPGHYGSGMQVAFTVSE